MNKKTRTIAGIPPAFFHRIVCTTKVEMHLFFYWLSAERSCTLLVFLRRRITLPPFYAYCTSLVYLQSILFWVFSPPPPCHRHPPLGWGLHGYPVQLSASSLVRYTLRHRSLLHTKFFPWVTESGMAESCGSLGNRLNCYNFL